MKALKNHQGSVALRILVGLAAAGLVLYFMHLVSNFIVALFFALIITVIAGPLLLWLRGKGLPDWLAFLITLGAVAVGVFLIVGFIINAAVVLAVTVPNYVTKFESLKETTAEFSANNGLFAFNIATLLGLVETRTLLNITGALLQGALDVFSNALIIIIFVVFMLVQYFTTPRLLRAEIAAGNTYAQRVVLYLENLRQYTLLTAVIGLITGALDTLLFLLLGIPNPFIWGGVAAILSFVPSIGFWLAAIPPTFLALFEYGPLTALLTLAGILLINGIADNYIKPRYLGSGLDLAPFLVIFSVIFWAIILGPVGAIIGVPLTMLIKTLILEADDDLSWLARVSGSGRTPAPLAEAETDAGQ